MTLQSGRPAMSKLGLLWEIFNVVEAGVGNEPVSGSRKRSRPAFGAKLAGNVTFPPSEEPDDPEDAEEHEDDLRRDTPFASKSQPPTIKPSTGGLRVTGDAATLEALQSVFESLRTSDQDLEDWASDCETAIRQSLRKGDGNVTLPKFEAAPDLDDFDDDGGSEEEEY